MSTKLAFVILIGGLIGLAWCGRKYYDSSRYVCMNCGLRKTENARKFGPVKYRSTRTFEDTAVSAALLATNCSHSWLLYSFGRGSGHLFRGWQIHADGGSSAYMLTVILEDRPFASELGAMPGARTVWSNLLIAVHTNRDLNESLGSWWQDGPDHGSFSNWWDGVSHRDAGRGTPN